MYTIYKVLTYDMALAYSLRGGLDYNATALKRDFEWAMLMYCVLSKCKREGEKGD